MEVMTALVSYVVMSKVPGFVSRQVSLSHAYTRTDDSDTTNRKRLGFLHSRSSWESGALAITRVPRQSPLRSRGTTGLLTEVVAVHAATEATIAVSRTFAMNDRYIPQPLLLTSNVRVERAGRS